MKDFLKNNGLWILFAGAVIAVALALLSYFSTNTSPLVDLANTITSPFRAVCTSVAGWFVDKQNYYEDVTALKEENEALKQQIAENHLDDPDKLADLVRQAAEEMGITLTDEQVSQIVDLLLKLSKLDIDPDKLANQAKELYNKLESMGITVDKEKVGNFITNFVSSIWELIQSFLNQ